MLLYHGTSMDGLRKIILNGGIKPRTSKSKRRSNWEHEGVHPSKFGFVYLTNAYAMYYASAANPEHPSKFAILEVDTDKLESVRLCPDEDFIVMAGKIKNEDVNPWHYRQYAELSIEKLGNACYKGAIPLSAITRVAIVDWRNDVIPTMALDPSISLMNYQFCGSRYRSYIKWVFEGTDPEDDRLVATYLDAERNPINEDEDQFVKELRESGRYFVQACRDLRPQAIEIKSVDELLREYKSKKTA